MTAIDAGAVERFRSVLARRLGLVFEDSRIASLTEVLSRRAGSTAGLETFLARIEGSAGWRDELRALAPEITVAETYFFRNPDQLRALVGAVLPDRLRARPVGTTLRLLSAGCASGEEAYTLAMLMRDELPTGRDVSICGIDVNPKVLEKARRARYSTWALRGTAADVRSRWFRTEGQELVLDPIVRAMVTFEERNLTEDDPTFWQPGTFDVVFCRNVLMYMSPEAARGVIARITTALAPGGFLFLGHAETMRGLSQQFHLRHTHDTFYYQQRTAGDLPDATEAESVGSAPIGEAAPPTEPVPMPMETGWADSWVEMVRRSSERIAVLAATTADRRAIPGSHAEVVRALELMREERFGEAQTLVASLPVETARDPDVLLLRAVLLTHGGDLDEAERVSAELLAMDEMTAGAHYVTALCRESAGDTAGAREHDLLAAYIDPTFAMPRLHLGLLSRRAGDAETARRELAHALILLEREDASRVLLFGGGFRRETLAALCRAELIACGGMP